MAGGWFLSAADRRAPLHSEGMAVIARRIDVGTTVKQLVIPETVTRYGLTITNRGTASIFVGGSDVTATEGSELGVGERMSIVLRKDDGGLFAVAASGTHRVDRIQVGWS